MPSRLVTGAILAFWLAMTGWLIHREVMPMIAADASPTYTPDLTDEIGSPIINWKIFRDGKRAGTATSRVIANDDRSYDFHQHYRFRDLSIGPVEMRTLEVTYKVSDDSKLKAMATKFSVKILGDQEISLELKGDVVDGELDPVLLLNGAAEKLPNVEKIKMPETIVNSMHLLSRLRGLRDGRTWKVPLPNLASSIKHPVANAVFDHVKGPSELLAVVSTDTLKWDGRDVACFKVEYRELNKEEIVASTWVRRLDGLVLQQETSLMGKEMVLQRVP